MQSTNVKIKRPDLTESTDQKAFTSQKMDWINAVVADHRIDASAKIVAICIKQHVNEKDEFGCFPSDECIADKTAMSVSTVKRTRNKLRAAGWLTWKRRMRSNLYWTLTEPMADVAERQQTLTMARKDRREAPPPAFSDRSPVTDHDVYDRSPVTDLDSSPVTDKHLTANTTKKEERKEESHDLKVADPSVIPVHQQSDENRSITMTTNHSQLALIPADPSDFEKWWRQYPRRVGKLKAQQEYAKAIKKGATHEELWAGAIRYAGEKMDQDPRFTKHPATWLSNGCWADEPQQPRFRGNDSINAGLISYCEER